MSRREQIRMTESEQAAYLAAAQTVIINSIGPRGVPHPMPMWFGIEDDGALVMTTFRKSQKVRNIERDPRVSLLVESGEVYSELRGVVLYGEAELLREHEQVVEILMRVNRRSVRGAQDASASDLRRAVEATAPKRCGLRVRPARTVSWDHSKLGGVY